MLLLLEGYDSLFMIIGHGDNTAIDNNGRQTGIIIICNSSARKFKQELMIKRLLIMVELEAFWWFNSLIFWRFTFFFIKKMNINFKFPSKIIYPNCPDSPASHVKLN